jgi:hypothetical protein
MVVKFPLISERPKRKVGVRNLAPFLFPFLISCPLIGVFAGSKKIPDGTFIGIYSGELLTDAEAHERGVYVTSTPFPPINFNAI